MSLRTLLSDFASAVARPCKRAFEAAAFKTAPGRFISRAFVRHHNKFQFFGYQPANVILALNTYRLSGVSQYGLNDEGYAALSFLIGSGAIYHFDFNKRPTRLLWGGLGLALGGGLLSSAGYPVSGVPVAIASLETARGGLRVIKEHVAAKTAAHEPISLTTKFSLHAGNIILAPYNFIVEKGIAKIPGLGEYLNKRPFIAGTLIKSPPRLIYIAQKIAEGDGVGTAVGFSWLAVGDTALTFNDRKFKAYFERGLAENEPEKPAETASPKLT
ncbi:MAG: hypothetical protein WBK55_04500 [Alphaproteobacteria bacterium]